MEADMRSKHSRRHLSTKAGKASMRNTSTRGRSVRRRDARTRLLWSGVAAMAESVVDHFKQFEGSGLDSICYPSASPYAEDTNYKICFRP
jgi:hypothetical protein